MLGRISRPFLSTRSVARPLNQARFFHRPSPYRVLNPKPFNLTDAPRIKVFAIDGAGSSGDFRNRKIKQAMKTITVDYFATQRCALSERVLHPTKSPAGLWMPCIDDPIAEFLGLGKLDHFIIILNWLKENDSNVRIRYNFEPDFLLYDANEIYKLLQSEKGLKIIRESRPVPGFKEVAEMLKNSNIKLVLQTAYGPKEAKAFMEGMEEGGVKFDDYVTSSSPDDLEITTNHKVKHSRPFMSLLEKVADKYGVNPEEILAPGDTKNDMKAARKYWRLGLPYSSSLFREKPTMTLEEEICEIDRVAKDLEEAGALYNLKKYDHKNPMWLQVKNVIDDIHYRMALSDFSNNQVVKLAPELRRNIPSLNK